MRNPEYAAVQHRPHGRFQRQHPHGLAYGYNGRTPCIIGVQLLPRARLYPCVSIQRRRIPP